MEQYIECPVCEERFHIEVDERTVKINCPGCARKFKVSSAIKLKSPPPSAAPSQTSTSPPAAVTSRLAVPKTPPQPPVNSDMTLEGEAPKLTKKVVKLPKSKPLTSTALRHRRRNKKKALRALATVGILATIIGVLAGLLVMQLQKRPIADNQNAHKESAAPAEQQTSIASERTRDPAAKDTKKSATKTPLPAPSKSPQKKVRLADLPAQKFIFHEKEAVEKCWEQIHPHLVNLTVHDALGSHQAVGTIIDSRGWILTSYSAIKGATKIDVTASVKSIDELPQPDLLTDVVRGIIATDAEKDIAILSINRRFVVSFADIKITTQNHIVEGEYMIQCTPPSLDDPYARHESKMKIREKFAALSDPAQGEIQRRKLQSPGLTWLATDSTNAPLPGSPLARIDGTLEALHVFSNGTFSYYLPLDQLRPLITNAKNDLQPLSVLGGGDLSSGQPVSVGTNHPMRQTSVQITKLSKACDEFGWLPTTREQYDKLQEFAEQFEKSIQYVRKHKNTDPELSQEAESQIETIKNSILTALSQLRPQSYAAIEQLNKFANEDLKKANCTIPIFAKVFELEVSAGSDILQLARTDSFIALNKDPRRERFERDRECLIFIHTPDSPRTLNYLAGTERVAATLVNGITRIDRQTK